MAEQRETKAEIRKLRQELGLCVTCGAPIEAQTRGYRLPLVRCAACRERETQRKYALKQRRAQLDALRAEAERRTRVDYMPPHAICESCVWSTYAGAGVWFCPLSVCVRVRLPEEQGDGAEGASDGAEDALPDAEDALEA